MNSQNTPVFDKKTANSYDQNADKAAPMMDALRYLTRLILADSPADARILCVGVGTGSELFALAQAYPNWQFTALDPAPAMLDICRARAAAEGVAQRCTFHEGTLDSLSESAPFDGATCFLVSHFFLDSQKRSEFFAQIAARLAPDAILVSADLSSDMASPEYQNLRVIWERMLRDSGRSEEQIAQFMASHGSAAAVLPQPEVAEIIAAGGFDAPVLFFQTLFIHGWYARRK